MKNIKKVANPFLRDVVLYSVITAISVVLYLLARAGRLQVLNFPAVYLIITATIGYAMVNSITEYRSFQKYRNLYPAQVYDRKSYEAFLTNLRAGQEKGEQLRR